MTRLKALSVAAVLTLVTPLVAPTLSFAQAPGGHAGGGAHARSGGGGMRAGGAGGGFRGAGGMRTGGGGAAQFRGGGGRFAGGAAVAGPRFNGGGGNYHGGYNGGHRRGGGGFVPGAVAGAVIGGVLASQSGYYAPGYYDSYGYYDEPYDDGAVAVAPGVVGGDDDAYCVQTYRSYDPASGTYLGYDGLRHPCP